MRCHGEWNEVERGIRNTRSEGTVYMLLSSAWQENGRHDKKIGYL